MACTTRYQGAIVKDHQILLIKHQEHASGYSYWVIPGGSRELNETEEDCVQREMLEETGLLVAVERLILDEEGIPLGIYKRLKTYLCRVIRGEARAGFEPEVSAAQEYAISEVRWFDLNNFDKYVDDLKSSPFILPLIHRIRAALGYSAEETLSDEPSPPSEKLP